MSVSTITPGRVTGRRTPKFKQIFKTLAVMGTLLFISVTSLPAQNVTVTVDPGGKTLSEVLAEITRQTGIEFSYNLDLVNTKITAGRTLKGSLPEVLDKLLDGTGVKYTIAKDHIYLAREKESVQEQRVVQPREYRVSGTVKSQDGLPLAGVTVVESQSNAVVTNPNGQFSMNVRPDSKLVFTYIGYQTVTENIGNRSVIDVTMNQSTTELDEVVVVGYGVQRKKDLTGAIGSVKMNEAPVNTASTISHLLAGSVAGLQVSTVSAQPGGATTFNIRGAGSINASNEPLIVIDGFPVSSAWEPDSGNRYDGGSKDYILGSLNPNDIESVEVFKDASATAIYGSQAGHGVILITTKRGKTGRPTIKYSGTGSVQLLSDTYKMLDAKGYMEQNNKLAYETYLMDNKITPYGPRELTPGTVVNLPYSDDQIANAPVSTDWVDAITRMGWQQQHNVSLSGGTEATQYLVSLGFFQQDGVIKSNGMRRLNGRVNLDQTISKHFKTGISLLLNRNAFDNIPLGTGSNEYAGIIRAATEFSPLLPIKDDEGNYSLSAERSFVPNPVSLLEITDKSISERMLGMWYLEAAPVKELKIRLNAGLDRRYNKRSTYLPKTTLFGQSANGEGAINQYDNHDFLTDLTATYSKQFASKHNLTAMVGTSYQQFRGEGLNAGNSNFVTDGFLYDNLGAGQFAKPTVGSWKEMSTNLSFFGRVNYSFLSRYLLTATVRADGSSNLAPGNQWGYFPSIALGWRFSDEPFMKGASRVLTNGKLRVSYGETGNSRVGNGYLDYFSMTLPSIFDEQAYGGVKYGQIGNKDLRWETTKEWNLGLEIGLFSRVDITIELYHRKIVDLLNTIDLMSYYPLPSVEGNVGSTKSKGVELTVQSLNISTRNFKWSSNFTFSAYKDSWLSRPDTWKRASYEGVNDPIRAVYGYLSGGLVQAGETVPHMMQALPGMIKILDINGFQRDNSGDIMYGSDGMPLKTGEPDGRLDDADKVLYGSWDPEGLFGFGNEIKFKSWNLNFYLYGMYGKMMGPSYIDNGIWGASVLSAAQNGPTAIADMWRSDNQDSKIPGFSMMRSSEGPGDFWYTKAWFIRMRNITLGYTFKWDRADFRIYADVNNPFVITNYKGLDPETDGSNVAYPNVRTFSLGLDLTF